MRKEYWCHLPLHKIYSKILVSALIFIKYFCGWVDLSVWFWAREKACISCKDAFIIPPLPLQYSSVPRNGDQVESLTELASSLMFPMRPCVRSAADKGVLLSIEQNAFEDGSPPSTMGITQVITVTHHFRCRAGGNLCCALESQLQASCHGSAKQNEG